MVTGKHACIVPVDLERAFSENDPPGVKSESCDIRLSTLNVLCREDDCVGTKADKSHNTKTISFGRKPT